MLCRFISMTTSLGYVSFKSCGVVFLYETISLGYVRYKVCYVVFLLTTTCLGYVGVIKTKSLGYVCAMLKVLFSYYMQHS